MKKYNKFFYLSLTNLKKCDIMRKGSATPKTVKTYPEETDAAAEPNCQKFRFCAASMATAAGNAVEQYRKQMEKAFARRMTRLRKMKQEETLWTD